MPKRRGTRKKKGSRGPAVLPPRTNRRNSALFIFGKPGVTSLDAGSGALLVIGIVFVSTCIRYFPLDGPYASKFFRPATHPPKPVFLQLPHPGLGKFMSWDPPIPRTVKELERHNQHLQRMRDDMSKLIYGVKYNQHFMIPPENRISAFSSFYGLFSPPPPTTIHPLATNPSSNSTDSACPGPGTQPNSVLFLPTILSGR